MNRTDLRKLMPPDEGLSPDRRHAMKEHVMASIRDEKTSSRAHGPEVKSGSRRRRRLVPVLASAFIVLVATTAAGALGLLPWQDQEILEEIGCRTPGSVEQLVAEAEAPNGGTQQLWLTKADADSSANGHILTYLDGQGGWVGNAIGCSPPGEDADDYYNGIWVSVPNEISDTGAVASVIGHAPSNAATATITFSDGTSTTVDTQRDGYFLGVVSRPDITGNAEFPEPVRLVAHDEDGNVITETSLP